MTAPGLSLKERFDLHWTPCPNTGCWIWTGALTTIGRSLGDDVGYGTMNVAGKMTRATRISLLVHGHHDQPGAFVLHSCDFPNCVNPDHLRFGSPGENVADMMTRGRHRVGAVELRQGERNGFSKLTQNQVAIIKSMTGVSAAVLARAYGVNKSAIKKIRLGENWIHVEAAWRN